MATYIRSVDGKVQVEIEPESPAMLLPNISDQRLQAQIDELRTEIRTYRGQPVVVADSADMEDELTIYLYMGSEEGFNAGHWYYYDGTEWVDGGEYVANPVLIDDTLTQSGEAADAKVTGDEITALKADLNKLIPLIGEQTIDIVTGEHRGSFISELGDIRNTAGSFAYSAPIQVYKDKKYTFVGTGTTIISAICSCDSSGNNRVVKNVYSATDIEQTFIFIPDEDGYVVFSYNYSQPYCLESYDVNLNSVRFYADEIEKISDYNENLIDLSTVILETNWTLSSATGRAIVNVDVNPLTNYVLNFPASSNFWNIIIVEKTSPTSTASVKSTGATIGGTLNIKTQLATNCLCIQFASNQTTTEEMFSDYDATVIQGDYEMTAIDYVLRKERIWHGKRLVWLGTSIPAGGKYNVNNKSSYPLMVGQRLGATVYNEAVGSSALHCKDPNRISTSNPYGFLANFEAVSRCITNSLEEMEWIIAHYNDSNVFTQGVPSSLSDADKEFIRSCSWEVKLQKYFTSENFPDAWVIDHGHNDIPSEYSESTYTAKSAMVGTQHDGYYNGGNFVQSTASSYLEFDVSDELYIWINGTFGSYYDRYDLYDSDGNNIGWFSRPNETTINDMKVNVVDATTLRVSNVNTLINTVTVKKLTYPMYNSLYSYQGGFDFIVNKIKEYNPRARIIMIGEYENQKYPTISENQIVASERWEFPLYRQWENLGWSQQYIKVNGEYITYLNYLIPDNLHPHSDTTGWALEQMANNISAWLKTIA